MKNVSHLLLIAACIATSPAEAVDLTQVPRTIGNEPNYQSQPKYGLLVFGPEATTRIWLVHDGDTLYADLNGDGDLRDPAERFTATQSSNVNNGTFRFEIGEVQEADRRHQSLAVYTMNLQHLMHSDSRIKAALTKNPQARFYGLRVELDVPGYRGVGREGRVEHLVSAMDANGVLLFAETPEEAPLIHFGGPWEATVDGELTLKVGRRKDVFLGIGTPGLGPGTTAFAAYQDLVPDSLCPKLNIAFPGENQPSAEFVLRKRCCTVNFHDIIEVPADVTAEEATVTVSFDDWLGGFVQPTTHRVNVTRPEVEITLEPVSERLKTSLIHPTTDGILHQVDFSPDGTQLLACDYPGGIVQLWDVETGDRLMSVETGFGFGSGSEIYHVSPDWTHLYTVHSERKSTRFLKDGEKFIRWDFNGAIHQRDLATGELIRKLEHSPSRHILVMNASPDNRFLMTVDEVGGELPGRPPRVISLWDLETGTSLELAAKGGYAPVFSADGRRVAVTHSEETYTDEIRVFDTITGERVQTIPVNQQFTILSLMGMLADETTLVSQNRILPGKNDWSSQQAELVFWDTTTGKRVDTTTAGQDEVFTVYRAYSPDMQTLALPNFRGEHGKLYLFDTVARELRSTIDFPEATLVHEPIYSPDGQTLAVITQIFPQSRPGELRAEDLAQPRIHLIDVATGEISETIVAPQGIAAALAFSPDGQTLASTGNGRVLLWDLSTTPGDLAGDSE